MGFVESCPRYEPATLGSYVPFPAQRGTLSRREMVDRPAEAGGQRGEDSR